MLERCHELDATAPDDVEVAIQSGLSNRIQDALGAHRRNHACDFRENDTVTDRRTDMHSPKTAFSKYWANR